MAGAGVLTPISCISRVISLSNLEVSVILHSTVIIDKRHRERGIILHVIHTPDMLY